MDDPDADLETLSQGDLLEAARAMRQAIRAHRDGTGHGLCWHHPKMWALLPDAVSPDIAVPPWPKFLRGCVKYRESLDRQMPGAPVLDQEYEG
jgi:hypothetical protein